MENKYTDEEWMQLKVIIGNINSKGLLPKPVLCYTHTMDEKSTTSFLLGVIETGNPYTINIALKLHEALFTEFSKVALLINDVIFNEMLKWRLEHGK